MEYVLGVLAGIAWGAAAAFINSRITRKSIEKQDIKAVTQANLLRFVVDLLALGSVFLSRKLLPFSFEAALVATAVTCSTGSVITAFKIGRELK